MLRQPIWAAVLVAGAGGEHVVGVVAGAAPGGVHHKEQVELLEGLGDLGGLARLRQRVGGVRKDGLEREGVLGEHAHHAAVGGRGRLDKELRGGPGLGVLVPARPLGGHELGAARGKALLLVFGGHGQAVREGGDLVDLAAVDERRGHHEARPAAARDVEVAGDGRDEVDAHAGVVAVVRLVASTVAVDDAHGLHSAHHVGHAHDLLLRDARDGSGPRG